MSAHDGLIVLAVWVSVSFGAVALWVAANLIAELFQQGDRRNEPPSPRRRSPASTDGPSELWRQLLRPRGRMRA